MAGVTKKYLARGAVAVVFAATAIIGCQQSLLIRDEIAQKIANANTKYTFTVTAGAGGTVSPGGSNTAGLGVPFPIAATPNTGGYLFSSWTAGGLCQFRGSKQLIYLGNPDGRQCHYSSQFHSASHSQLELCCQ